MKPCLAAAFVVSGLVLSQAQTRQGTLPLEPSRERGASVTPAFEGWYANPDGSFTLLVGYYNRNSKQTLDVPIGPDNKIEPGPPDQGQPTYFETGRQWGVFTIKVPKDFGTRTLTWTIVSNGETQSIPFTLNKGYPISPFKELGMGNQPPVLSFAQDGPKFTGPPVGTAATLTGTVGQPMTLNVWVEDPKPAQGERGRGPSSVASVSLHKHRGPGIVTFDKARVPATRQGEMVSSTATFGASGDYVLRIQANDESGEGGAGFQCCWTNALVKVTVR